MGVFDAAVVGPGGEALAPHGREWGDATARWGGRRRTGVSFLDSEEPANLRADLRAPRDAASRRGRRRRRGSRPPVLRVLVDARPRAGVAGALEAGRTAQAGRDSRAQGRRGPRLVPRPASGGLGLRGDTLARLRRAGGGPDLPRPYRPRQDPRSHRTRRRGDPLRHPGQVPPAASLVLRLGKAKREGALDRLVADIGQASLVMLDEFGTFPSKSTWPACPTRP